MKRPLFAIGLSWFFATWLAYFCGAAVLQMSLAALLTAVLCFVLRGRYKHAYAACVVLLAASVAFAVFWVRDESKVKPVLALSGTTATVEGLITEVDTGMRAMTYTMSARFSDYPELPETTLIVRDFSGIEQSAGASVRFDVALSLAPDSTWYRSRGILLIGQSPENAESIPVGKYRFERALMRLRILLSRNLYANLTEENADIVSAMVLGLKSDVPAEIYSSFGKSGTVHLLSVSGLHLSILSAAIMAVLGRFTRSRVLSAIITIAFGFAFAAVAGFGASVFRSFVMTAAALIARCFFARRNDSLTALGVALLLCAVLWPHWALGWSIWLSAGSTLGIILYSQKLTDAVLDKMSDSIRVRGVAVYIAEAVGLSLAAYAFTLPIAFLMSGWVSLISPLSNLLVAPFVPVVIFGGAVCAFAPSGWMLSKIVAMATDFSTEVIVKISEILGALDFAILAIDESWMLIFLAGVSVIVAVLMLFRANKRMLAYAAALIAVCFCAGNFSLAAVNRDKIELITLDGRNAAVLLRGTEAVVLGTPDAYEISTLLRYLTFRGVKHIPAIIATDSPDNVGSGLLRLTSAYPVDCIIAPNDAYVEENLARALPQSMVYSGGYAEIDVLGGVRIIPDLDGVEMHIFIGKNEAVKIRREYAIIDSNAADKRIRVFENGKMLLPRHINPLFEPAGAFLFGESRILLG